MKIILCVYERIANMDTYGGAIDRDAETLHMFIHPGMEKRAKAFIRENIPFDTFQKVTLTTQGKIVREPEKYVMDDDLSDCCGAELRFTEDTGWTCSKCMGIQ